MGGEEQNVGTSRDLEMAGIHQSGSDTNTHPPELRGALLKHWQIKVTLRNRGVHLVYS